MPIGTYLNAIDKRKETTYVLYFTLCGKKTEMNVVNLCPCNIICYVNRFKFASFNLAIVLLGFKQIRSTYL